LAYIVKKPASFGAFFVVPSVRPTVIGGCSPMIRAIGHRKEQLDAKNACQKLG
jgi:hypothetical protein